MKCPRCGIEKVTSGERILKNGKKVKVRIRIMKKRVNYPFGRNSKPRKMWECKICRCMVYKNEKKI